MTEMYEMVKVMCVVGVGFVPFYMLESCVLYLGGCLMSDMYGQYRCRWILRVFLKAL